MPSYMAPNLLNLDFNAKAKFKKLSTDVAYIPFKDRRFYLSAVKDLFDDEIIAHKISYRNDMKLIIGTIKQVPSSNGIVHSDQGSQY